jgi:hypothetical protein
MERTPEQQCLTEILGLEAEIEALLAHTGTQTAPRGAVELLQRRLGELKERVQGQFRKES